MDFDNNCIYRCKFNKKIRGIIFLLVKNTLKVIYKHEFDINGKTMAQKIAVCRDCVGMFVS